MMSHLARLLVCAALLAATTACSRSSSDRAAARDVQPALAPAPAATPAATPAEPAAAPSPAFALTMGRVDAYLSAFRNLAKLVQENPSLEDVTAMDASNENETQYAARIRTHPEVVAAMAQAGLTPEEFAKTGDALIAGMMTQGALESGALKKIPDGINPQFVEFARQNKAVLAARMKALQAGR